MVEPRGQGVLLAVVSLACLMAAPAHAAGIPTLDERMPGPAQGAPAAAVGEHVFAFRPNGASTAIDLVHTSGLVSLEPAIAGRAIGAAAALGNHVHVFVALPEGGSRAYALDAESRKVSPGPSLPFVPVAATAYGNAIVLLGTCTQSLCEGNATVRFTPATGALELLGPFDGPVAGATFAGLDALVPQRDGPTGLWRLDAVRGHLERQPFDLPVAVHGAAALLSPCGLMAFGGKVGATATDLVQTIDATTGRVGVLSWRLPGPAGQPTAVAASGIAFILGVGQDATEVAVAPVAGLCDVALEPETPAILPDADGDGVPDATDNCPAVRNDQADRDGDAIGDACDALHAPPATTQVAVPAPAPSAGTTGGLAIALGDLACAAIVPDLDRDGITDVCDPDLDGDGILDKGATNAFLDICPRVPDPDQRDTDRDGAGDACDSTDGVARTARLQARALAPVQAPTMVLPQVVLLGAVAALGGAWLGRHKWLAFLVVGFTRLRGEELVEQPVRRQILQLVTAQPGVHHQELRRRLGIGRGNLDHHVQVLLRSGHIREHRGSGYRCYFPPNTGAAAMRTSGVLKSELAQRLYEQVLMTPGCAVSELARKTMADYRAVAYHLERFEGAGVAHLRHDGTTMRAYPAEGTGAK